MHKSLRISCDGNRMELSRSLNWGTKEYCTISLESNQQLSFIPCWTIGRSMSVSRLLSTRHSEKRICPKSWYFGACRVLPVCSKEASKVFQSLLTGELSDRMFYSFQGFFFLLDGICGQRWSKAILCLSSRMIVSYICCIHTCNFCHQAILYSFKKYILIPYQLFDIFFSSRRKNPGPQTLMHLIHSFNTCQTALKLIVYVLALPHNDKLKRKTVTIPSLGLAPKTIAWYIVNSKESEADSGTDSFHDTI
jgi:hypothetical protein